MSMCRIFSILLLEAVTNHIKTVLESGQIWTQHPEILESKISITVIVFVDDLT